MTENLSFVGLIRSPFGLKGGTKSEIPGSTLSELNLPISVSIHYPNTNELQTLTLVELQTRPQYTYVRFQEVTNPEAWKGKLPAELWIPSDWITESLPTEEYYVSDLVGSRPILELGKDNPSEMSGFQLEEILELTHDTILIFRNQEKKEVLIPFRKQFVGDLKTSSRELHVPSFMDFLHAS